MEKNPKFDDIRPYYDEEAAPAIELLLKDPQFQKAMHYIFSDRDCGELEQSMRKYTNLRDFQLWLAKNVVVEVLNRSSSGFTCSGFEKVSKTDAYIYISNHRDIVLDASILDVKLIENGFETAEVAIGDNLLLTESIKDMVRLNKSFIVKRNLPLRQTLEASLHLSEYIRYTIRCKNQSIWIAQREGRAKDSNDRTQESVLKMLAMGGDRNFIKSLEELNLVPTTFSYEYDPCDFLKAKEFQQKKDNPDFKKTKEDDLLSMKTGLFGYKGEVHLQIGNYINPSLLKLDATSGRNELAKEVASLIDKEIFRNYKFFPVNYIAYDRIWGNNFFKEKYTPEDIEKFDKYFQQQLNKIDLPNKDIPFLKEKMMEMYAYPVRNNYETMFDVVNYKL